MENERVEFTAEKPLTANDMKQLFQKVDIDIENLSEDTGKVPCSKLVFDKLKEKVDIDKVAFEGVEIFNREDVSYIRFRIKTFDPICLIKDLVIQWGKVSSVPANDIKNVQLGFSCYSYKAFCCFNNNDKHNEVCYVRNQQPSNFEVFNSNGTPMDINWFAIGFIA